MPFLTRTRLIPLCFAMLTALLALQQCRGPESAARSGPVRFDPAQIPFQKLSEYAFFKGEMNGLQPNDRVMPYELITPLFTDYAHKARFVWMPDSVRATVDSSGMMRFPDNTVLIKNFYYPADFRRPEEDWDIVETRLLVRRAGKWEAFTYVWNEEQTEASLNVTGDFRQVRWTDEQGGKHDLEYVIPNKNQCKSCHNERNVVTPVGPKVRNLNKTITYPGGEVANQLSRWQEEGLLAPGDYASAFKPLAAWDDPKAGSLEDRALGYLDVNCGHCHRPEGPAHTSGLYLTVDYAHDRGHIGVRKTPVAAGKGSGGYRFGIDPGKPDSSILVFRMQSRDPGVMMPELGRVNPHEEGIALVREWIAGLKE